MQCSRKEFGMPASIAPRIAWAVDILELLPGDRTPEVSGGHGVAAGLLAQLPRSGHTAGLDRLAKVAAIVDRRNV
jgi:hypothetical protein